jgi:hypothetical protein
LDDVNLLSYLYKQNELPIQADYFCENEDGVNYCMNVTLFERPPQVTDSVHINGTSTAAAPTGTTTATSATSSPSLDTDTNNCGVLGKVCESYESCVLGACDSSTIQYTSDLADWTKMNKMALAVSSVTDHTPDGVLWAVNGYTKWDGVPKTFVDDFSSNKQDFHEWICPGAIPRGIREVYYMDPVFTDPKNPTKAEVDHWHRRFVTSC